MPAGVDAPYPGREAHRLRQIASAFFYLASPDAAFLTGQVLVIDGGRIGGATAAE
ncbi:SDR family oxidoreductase [Streptomyces sp. AS58]|uniref:SDR family oxidoreductase n=1 Tax=Streptomyces sp. AS58 TaxID=1519489 RepID=UPI00099B56B4|nr:SDR family oxidoreductase [Streptomyces sp. AS58]